MSELPETGKSIRESVEDASTAREQDNLFERGLGRFMIAWSDTEAELYRVLVHYTQVSDPVARALFSGTRALLEAKTEGLPYVEITADIENIASQRVILRNGGLFVEQFIKPLQFGGTPSLRYRIALI